MTDRDLHVFVLLVMIALMVGLIETVLDITPSTRDGIVDAIMVAGVGAGFYKIGKESR